MNKLIYLIIAFPLIFVLSGCSENYIPKPKGYPRIDIPNSVHLEFNPDCPFTFSYPSNCKIFATPNAENPCWFNIDYPALNARIHLSYKSVEDNLDKYLEDSRTLVYKHTVKANAIHNHDIENPENSVYARIYSIEGDVASAVQFFATDSANHFLRGALYFNSAPNADSLQPAVDHITNNIEALIKSLHWKEAES